MGIIFFIPLALIAFYESTFDKYEMADWFKEDEDLEDPQNRNPEVNDPNCKGLEISKVPFEELIKVFPQTDKVWISLCVSKFANAHGQLCLQSSETSILEEIHDVKKQLHALVEKLDKLHS